MKHSNEPICPKCGTRMTYRIEAELGNGDQRTIYYYYKCPRCGYRVQDLIVKIKGNNGLKIIEAKIPRKIYSRK